MGISVDSLQSAINKQLQQYGDIVYRATENGLDAAEKVLIKNLKEKSPTGETGDYAKSWKSKGKKYNLKRYVGNTKMVKGKKSDIPLSNILEYADASKHKGLIDKICNGSIDAMADAVVSEIKKGVY